MDLQSIQEILQDKVNNAIGSQIFWAGIGISAFHYIIRHSNVLLNRIKIIIKHLFTRDLGVSRYDYAAYERMLTFTIKAKPIYSRVFSYKGFFGCIPGEEFTLVPFGTQLFSIAGHLVKITTGGSPQTGNNNGEDSKDGSNMAMDVALRKDFPVISITIFFGTKRKVEEVRQAIQDFSKEWREEKEREKDILRIRISNPVTIGMEASKLRSDVYEFSPEFKLIKERVQHFMDSKDRYRRKSWPFKYSILCHGIPGNGKSTCIKYVASSLDLATHFVGLENMPFSTFFEILAHYSACSPKRPTIIVLEDVDAIPATGKRPGVQTREGKISSEDGPSSISWGLNHGMNLSDLLNIIDGVFSPEHIIYMFTTNRKSSLDTALLRKGRVDLDVEFKNPTLEFASAIAAKTYDLEHKTVMEDMRPTYRDNYTLADFGGLVKESDTYEDFLSTWQTK